MLVCICGFPGSGRDQLAETLSKATGFHLFSFVPIKKDFLISQAHALARSQRDTDASDKLLTRIYQQAVSRLCAESKMYPDVIVPDAFKREVPREFFFDEVNAFFGPPLVLWVDSSEEEEIAHLKQQFSDRPSALERKLKAFDEIRANFQPFTRPVHSIRFLGNPAALDQALELVHAHRTR